MLRRLFLPALNFVLPATCLACDTFVEAGLAPALCGDCWLDLTFHTGPQCRTCATRVDAVFTAAELQCGVCLTAPPAYTSAKAAFVYDGAARTLILALKHGSKRACASFLAGHMLAHLPNVLDQACLVPVPLHTARLRQRGFNQSLALAQHLGRLADVPVHVNAVQRIKNTPSQGTMSRRHRARNVARAFHIPRPQVLAGRHVILIDDVITSGATANALAAICMKAGANSVCILAAARALPT